MKVPDSSELRRSAHASLHVVEVLINLSNPKDEKNSSECFAVPKVRQVLRRGDFISIL
jgi:hypothetical protein